MLNDHLVVVRILAKYCLETGRLSVCPRQQDILERLSLEEHIQINKRTLQLWIRDIERRGLVTRAKQNSRGVGGNTILPITHYRLTQKAIALMADQAQLAKAFLILQGTPKEKRP